MAALLVALIKIPMHFYRKSPGSDVLPWTPDLAHTHGLVPKSGTFTSCDLGGARFHRLPEGVTDFMANNQLGIFEGAGFTSLKAELPPYLDQEAGGLDPRKIPQTGHAGAHGPT